MASEAFRDSLNSLGWNRRDADLPVRTSSNPPIWSKLQSYNPFASSPGALRLPTDENPGAPLPARTRREEEEGWFVLSRWDRLLLFGGLIVCSVALFVVCFTLLPVLGALSPRKFPILWSMASVLFLAAWGVLMGPVAYVRHLLSGPRLPFTATYLGSIALTLYFAVGLHSTVLTLLSAIVQMVCLIWYIVSYFPMGSSGLRLAASFGTNRVAAWMGG